MPDHIFLIDFRVKRTLLPSLLLIFLLPQLCLAQKKKAQLELGLMATYSQFYFHTDLMPNNDVGGCLAMYFYKKKEAHRVGVRWGLELQQTRFNIDSAVSMNGYSKNIRFSLHQLRIPLYFPITVAKFKSGEIFVEPGVFASIPLPGIGREDFYRLNSDYSGYSGPTRMKGWFMQQPDFGVHFGLGMSFKTSLGDLTVRGDYCFGSGILGKLIVDEGDNDQTTLFTTRVLRAGAILRLPQK